MFHFETGGNGAIPFSLPYTAYTDRGHHDFDSFPLSSVPRKDNTQV